MEDFLAWIIIIALLILIGNQNREKQEREMKGMPKEKKTKYLEEIKKKQEKSAKDLGKVALWIIGILFLFLLIIFYIS